MNNPSNANGNMNIRRFVAENSRAALRQVKEALGGDAIILANRTIDGGRVEVLAAAPEAVDALTRRMTATTPSSLPIATPTELGLTRNADAPIEPVSSTTTSVARKRLSTLFGRRTQAQAEPQVPTFAEQTTPVATATNAAKVAGSYASFADELAAAHGSDEDFLATLAPESVALSRPAPAMTTATPVVETAKPIVAQVEVAPVIVAPAPAMPVVEPSLSVAEINDVVVREVHREVTREISREFGRDVINDLTRDVSREVSVAVAEDVTRDVVREVTRDVTREIRAMQSTLSEQLATLTWTDAMRRQPARTKLMQDLILAGFSPALSRHIQERLPDDYTNDEAQAWAESILRRNLPVANDAEELINEGGVSP